METASGIKCRVVPFASEKGRLTPCKAGEYHAFTTTSASSSYYIQGTGEFFTPEWGPQPIRVLSLGCRSPMGICVRGSSKINTLAELKGKKVAYTPGSTAVIGLTYGALRFGNLKWEDVVIVNYPSHPAACKGVLEGTCDAAFMGVTGSQAYELASSPHGIRWLPLPVDDKEGWKRMLQVIPYAYPMPVGNRAAGGDKLEIAQTPSYGVTYFLGCYPTLNEIIAYTITKAAWEGYPLFKSKHPDYLIGVMSRLLKSSESLLLTTQVARGSLKK
jgi:hypothetical protein